MASADNNNKENSFKKMESFDTQQVPQPSPQVERNVLGTARSVGFLGNVIELYLSRALGVIAALFGGKETEDEYINTEFLKEGNFDNDNDIMPSGRTK